MTRDKQDTRRPASRQAAAKPAAPTDRGRRSEELLDEALKESFPASDPRSIDPGAD